MRLIFALLHKGHKARLEEQAVTKAPQAALTLPPIPHRLAGGVQTILIFKKIDGVGLVQVASDQPSNPLFCPSFPTFTGFLPVRQFVFARYLCLSSFFLYRTASPEFSGRVKVKVLPWPC